MMTCFDILFKEPGIPLVEEYNVTNFAFPTAWMDALPLLPAIGFHSSFARAHGVNFLSANIHHPMLRFDGSGLYAPDGADGFYYGAGFEGLKPKLVVADMKVITPEDRRNRLASHSMEKVRYSSTDQSLNTTIKVDPIPSKEFTSELFDDEYTFRALEKPSDSIKVCQGKTCCELEYTVKGGSFAKDALFAVGAFDGIHSKEGSYYMQNCVLVKCTFKWDRKTCGSLVFASTTSFSKITLRADVQTKYVYPHVLLSDLNGQLGVSPPGQWDFVDSAIRTTDEFNGTVMNVILLGRDYTRDEWAPSSSSVGDSAPAFDVSLQTLLLVLCLGCVMNILVRHSY